MTDDESDICICPCIDCILIPICRHKQYNVLFLDCTLVMEYVPSYMRIGEGRYTRIREIQGIIQPTNWNI